MPHCHNLERSHLPYMEMVECVMKYATQDDGMRMGDVDRIKLQEDLKHRQEYLDRLYTKDRRWYWRGKRVFDIVFSTLALTLLSPVFLGISLFIVISDPHAGPIYKQVRLGRHAKPFIVYKFRTMVANADELLEQLKDQNEMNGPVFKIADDPRIIRGGRFLRRTGLDELPQFVNVLMGNMTVVGPRPPLPQEVAHYSEFDKLRLMVTPGLTCAWQIQPRRNDLSFEEWMDLDISYICDRNFWGDIKIILATVRTMLRRDGR